MLVASWNIQDGGLDDDDPARLVAQLELLASLDPTIVCIQEAKGWDSNGSRALHLAEHKLGMRCHLARAPRHNCHTAVLVRADRLTVLRDRHQEYPPFWDGDTPPSVTNDAGNPRPWHAEARVLMPGLLAASIHRSPWSSIFQAAEAQCASELASGPTIMAGDFNDTPIGDQPDRSKQPPYKRVRHTLPGYHDLPDDTAARILQHAGFIDVAAHLATEATDEDERRRLLAPTAGFTTPSIPVRCDRIYTTPHLKAAIRTYRTFHHPNLSDHDLLLAEIAA